MRTTILSLILAFATPAFAGDVDDLDKKIEAFERRTGVNLHLVGTDTPTKKGSHEHAVDPELALRALPALEDALMHYTDEVRGGMLKDLYLIGKLRMRGKPFLGVARPKQHSFDLAIRRSSGPFRLKNTMHHEIAHLVEHAEFFPAEMWKAFGGGKYKGKEPGKKWAAGSKGLDSARISGFVSKYASKNRHEDFAEMAELAFTQPGKMRKLGENFPLIGDKLRVMTDVYRRIAPGSELPWTTFEPVRKRKSNRKDNAKSNAKTNGKSNS